jgi:hypothetical protein
MNKYKVWTEEVLIRYWEVEAESPEWAEATVRALHEWGPDTSKGEIVERVNFVTQLVEEVK